MVLVVLPMTHLLPMGACLLMAIPLELYHMVPQASTPCWLVPPLPPMDLAVPSTLVEVCIGLNYYQRLIFFVNRCFSLGRF